LNAGTGEETGRRRRRRTRRFHVEAYLWFGGFFLIALFLTHWAYLDLPYFWDEAGQFIPAAFDLYRDGRLVPVSATPNVHPPGVMAWISLAWWILLPSIEVTRGAMLVAAALSLLAAFLLMVELTGKIQGAPALLSIFFLLLSPLVFTQSMLAQLDLPAMGLSALALYLFLRDRHAAAALACSALVLVKETGALLPVILFLWLLAERRRAALLYLVPLAALGGWLWLLRTHTGVWLGNREFAQYNVANALQPERIGVALARRAGFFFLQHGHFLIVTGALLALIARKLSLRSRAWAVAAVFALAHILLVTLLGGAVLERYLLPALPIYYALAAAAFQGLGTALRLVHVLGLSAALAFSLFWNPPWPFPYENNLAMVDFVRLQQEAARYLSAEHKHARVATAWPLSAALRKPDLGYVEAPMRVTERPTFAAADFANLRGSEIDVFALYSREWSPRISLLGTNTGRAVARRLFDWRDPIDGQEIEKRLEMRLERRLLRNGHWIEIYSRRGLPVEPVIPVLPGPRR
jgi:4-amino-4-deoxy-L-arabinose transferase-like glycosyltransferase